MKKFILSKQIILPLLTLLIILIAAYIQTLPYANRDAIWLTHCTSLFLHGGRYYYDFFETNPPLILYFYTPPTLISDFLGVNNYATLIAYVFLWITYSLFLSYSLLKSLFKDKTLYTNTLYLALAAIFSILPLAWFSEREHITAVLTTPYFFLIVCRLWNIKIQPKIILASAFLAAIGFSLKPYFLPALVLAELYLAYEKKSWRIWLRSEPIIIASFMMIYAISSWFLFPEYFQYIIPISQALYLPYFAVRSFSFMITSAISMLGLLTLFLSYQYLKVIAESTRRSFVIVFMLASLGFYITYLDEYRNWYYHAIPMMTFNLILLTFLILYGFEQLKKSSTWKKEFVRPMIGSFFSALLIISELSFALSNNFVYFIEKKLKTATATQLITYLNQEAPNEKVAIFSSWFLQESARHYTNAEIVGRFPSQLLVPGLQSLANQSQFDRYQKLKDYYLSLTLSDLNRAQPSYLFFEKMGYTLYEKGTNKPIYYSFLPFFLSDPRFADFMKSYQLLEETPVFIIYKRAEKTKQ